MKAEMSLFRNLKFQRLAAKVADCPNDGLPEIVMAGRSNVGKSSLINAISGQKRLARVSSTPGKTRHVIYYLKENLGYLADLPGYGFAKVSKREQERFSQLVEDYFNLGRPIAQVLLLLDVRHDPNAHDVQMIRFMREAGLPFALVFTKCDKLSAAQTDRRIREHYRSLQWDENMAVFAVSAMKRLGLEALEAFMFKALSDYSR